MSQVPDYGLIGEGGFMEEAAKSLPIDAQVRRFLRYAPNFEGKRIVEAYIEELEAAIVKNLGKRDAERRRFKLGNPGRSLDEPTDEEVDAYLARVRGLVQPKTYECCGAPASGEHRSTCPLYGKPDEQPTTVDALALYDKESWDVDQRDGD